MKTFYKAIYQIISTGHRITDQVSAELKEFDISEPQFNVLRILRGRKGAPISVQDIQAKMVQRTSNVTRLIDKLLTKKLVQRKECVENRRKMDITITQRGLDLLPKLDKKIEAMHRPLMSNLNEEELKTLTALIIKLKNSEA